MECLHKSLPRDKLGVDAVVVIDVAVIIVVVLICIVANVSFVVVDVVVKAECLESLHLSNEKMYYIINFFFLFQSSSIRTCIDTFNFIEINKTLIYVN